MSAKKKKSYIFCRRPPFSFTTRLFFSIRFHYPARSPDSEPLPAFSKILNVFSNTLCAWDCGIDVQRAKLSHNNFKAEPPGALECTEIVAPNYLFHFNHGDYNTDHNKRNNTILLRILSVRFLFGPCTASANKKKSNRNIKTFVQSRERNTNTEIQRKQYSDDAADLLPAQTPMS